jgi:holo-[acyl-carrier protein] synthase
MEDHRQATPAGGDRRTRGTPVWRVGIDLTSVGEVERSLAELGDRYLDRLFTPHEIETCRTSRGVLADSLAARFAAKEATVKVLRPRENRPTWREIEVRRLASGACDLVLHGTASALAAAGGIQDWSLSMSHEGGMAVAIVLGWGWLPAGSDAGPGSDRI